MKLKPIAAAVALVLLDSTPARYAVSRNPLNVDISNEDFKAAPRGASIESLIPADLIDTPIVCFIDGQFISRACWHTPVRPGEIVVFQAVPQGGGGGSNPLRILLTIAVMVASIYVPGLLGLTGANAAFAGAAISILGNLAINALIPLPKAGSFEGSAPSPTYSVSFQGNSARMEQPIPIGYGQQLQFPDFASQPYAEFIGNEQYYHAALCIGKGQYQVLRVQIDDTDIRTFSDVEYQIIGPGQAQGSTLSAQSLVNTSTITSTEVGGQELSDANYLGAFAVCRPGYKVNQIAIDMAWPRGLGNVSDTGEISNRTSAYWVQARVIDDNDRAMTEWVTIGSESVVRATATAQTTTVKYAVSAARYQVRVRRVDTFSDSSRALNDLMWAGMRGVIDEPGVVDDASTYLVLRIRASKQLSGASQRKFGVLWRRLVPVWNGSTWSLQHTRNPAWAIADIWRNAEYGRGLPDSRIDLQSLLAMAQMWESRQDRFDFIFDSRTTIFEAAQLAARAGRAVPIVRRGRYTLVRDGEQTLPVALYTPRNIRKGSLQIEYAMPSEDMPDAVRIKYRSGRVWDERAVIAQVKDGEIFVYRENSSTATGSNVPGTTADDLELLDPATFPVGFESPYNIQDLQLPGVVGEKQASREAAYILAAGHFRRQTVSWSTDQEGLIPAYGSLVAVAHDVPSWGQSGEILAFDPASKRIRVSAPLRFTGGASHFIRIAAPAGAVSSPISVLASPEGENELVLEYLPSFEIIGQDDADREPSRFVFGDSVQVCEYVRIKGIRPKSGGQIDLTGVVEDARVHAADAPWMSYGGIIQDPLNDGTMSEIENQYTEPPIDSQNVLLTNTLVAEIPISLSRNAGFEGRMSVIYDTTGRARVELSAGSGDAYSSLGAQEINAEGTSEGGSVGSPEPESIFALWASNAPISLSDASGFEMMIHPIASGAVFYRASSTEDGVAYSAVDENVVATIDPLAFYEGSPTDVWLPLSEPRLFGTREGIHTVLVPSTVTEGNVEVLLREITIRVTVRMRANTLVSRSVVFRMVSEAAGEAEPTP